MSTLYIHYPNTAASIPSSAFPLLAPNGTAAAPSYSFASSTGAGMYLAASNKLGFAAGGVAVGSMLNTGVITLGDITNSIDLVIDPTSASPIMTFSGAISGNSVRLRTGNQSNTANSHAITESFVSGTSAGNPIFRSNINDLTFWSWGLNQSASNQFQISASSNVGASNKLIIGTAATAGVQLLGTGTNDSATTGFVGEYIESVVSSPTAWPSATGVWGNLATISLTAGDWNVTGGLNEDPNGSTQSGIGSMAVSLFSGATTTDHVAGSNVNNYQIAATTAVRSAFVSEYRVSVSSTTTVYLKGLLAFVTAVPTYTGRISARRVR